MKKYGVLAPAGLLGLLGLSGAWAQPGGRGGRRHCGMMWDANAVTTVAGEVAAVENSTPGRGGSSSGLRLTIKTDQETLPIILGPASSSAQQHFALPPKDLVEIKGSRLSIPGQPTIIAAEVKKGNNVLKLRDDRGIPLRAGLR